MKKPFHDPPDFEGKAPPGPPPVNPNDPVELKLISSFFRMTHTPWARVPAPGLTNSETRILFTIHGAARHDRQIRVRDISKELRVSSPTVTQHINSLESRGLVLREQSKDDKREVRLVLTELGEQTLMGHRDVLAQNFRELAATLGEEDAEKLADLIQKTCDFFSQKEKEYID